jgi:hypothetical protein
MEIYLSYLIPERIAEQHRAYVDHPTLHRELDLVMVFWVWAARHLPLASGVSSFQFQALHVPPPPTSPSGAGGIGFRGGVDVRHSASFRQRGYKHSADDQDHK